MGSNFLGETEWSACAMGKWGPLLAYTVELDQYQYNWYHSDTMYWYQFDKDISVSDWYKFWGKYLYQFQTDVWVLYRYKQIYIGIKQIYRFQTYISVLVLVWCKLNQYWYRFDMISNTSIGIVIGMTILAEL